MNRKDVIKWVKRIKDMSGDDEAAHTEEDLLYRAFIRHVSQFGDQELAAMASEVLRTGEIDFQRWCA